MVEHGSSFRIALVSAALVFLAAPGIPAVTAGAASPAIAKAAVVVPSNWSVASTPSTDPMTFTSLNDVSCVGPTFCMAVGQTQVGSNDAPLVEVYDGSWSILSVPAPPGNGSYFTSVSCTSPKFCAAVGLQYPGSFQQNFVEIWNGTTWSITAAPDRSATANGFVSGVSCVNPTFCIAVGGDVVGGADASLVEQWNGTAWSIVTDAPSGGRQPELNQVSCLSTSFCSAVGASFFGVEVPYTEFWNGTSWRIATTPAISGATQTLFSGVSCALPTMCMAAGYQDNGSASGNLVEQWNGTAWNVQSVPNPPPPGLGSPSAVDCFGPTSCVLVGQATQGFGSGPTMVVTWNGTAWSLGATPQPGYQPSLADSIHGISCVGGSWCVGVGSEADSSSYPQPMILTAPIPRPGYYEVADDGGLFAFGPPFFGSMGGQPLNAPIVGMAVTPDGGGYWEVASDGGLFAFGDAPFYGSMGGQPLNKAVVGIAVTPDGRGYWEVASDGGLFAFGDAQFYGSMGGQPLNKAVVGMAVTPDGGGYLEVASDGGIFAFGDAVFQGSMGGKPLNKAVVGIVVAPSGGYYEVATDGGLFAFGVPFDGSMGGQPLNRPVVGMAMAPAGGYFEVASDGGLFAFGGAVFQGSMGGKPLNRPVVGIGQ